MPIEPRTTHASDRHTIDLEGLTWSDDLKGNPTFLTTNEILYILGKPYYLAAYQVVPGEKLVREVNTFGGRSRNIEIPAPMMRGYEEEITHLCAYIKGFPELVKIPGHAGKWLLSITPYTENRYGE